VHFGARPYALWLDHWNKSKKNDMEVFITRGKDSIKTLRYLRTNNIKSVLSNYEDKIIRYLQHQLTNNVGMKQANIAKLTQQKYSKHLSQD
jgi:hypothetical protein